MSPRSSTPFIAALCIVLAFAAGLLLGGHPGPLPEPVRDAFDLGSDEERTRAELIESIEDSFYKPVDVDKLRNAEYDGIVRSLNDRFSHYFTPEETKEFNRAVNDPQFEGIGVSVAEDDRGLRIVQVYDDSPAQKAGLLKDDLITGVGGKSIAGAPSDVSTAKIKGKAGTEVRLTVVSPSRKEDKKREVTIKRAKVDIPSVDAQMVKRDGKAGTEVRLTVVSPSRKEDKKREVTIKRAKVDIPAVDAQMVKRDGKKIAHVQLFSFTNGAHGEMRAELDKLVKQGAEGVILDLRGNGGGLLQEGILVSSTFIEDGLIVSTKGRARPERRYNAEGDAISEKLPMVVLTDGGSASASEIVTGALRDRKRATIVGEKTFGKGVFQEVENLPNGGSLDLTVGSYYLPSGENISGKGIPPQVKAKDDPKTDRDEALPVAIRTLAEKIAPR